MDKYEQMEYSIECISVKIDENRQLARGTEFVISYGIACAFFNLEDYQLIYMLCNIYVCVINVYMYTHPTLSIYY